MKIPRWLVYAGAAAGVFLLALYWYPLRFRILHGINDFLSFYCGGVLMGSPAQYDPAAYQNLEAALTGYTGDAWLFIRLPAFALPFRALSRLPFPAAYFAWQSLMLAALICFVRISPKEQRKWMALALCWSFPLSSAFVNGQDDAILLLWIALALRWAEKRPLAAGLILSLCAMKFHLFLLLPVALLAARRWKMLAGLTAAGAGIFGLCFVAAGPHWLGPYLQAVLNPATNPHADMMPNLRGLVAGLPDAGPLEILLGLGVAACVWRIAARQSLAAGMAGAVLGGLLVSHHDYLADLVLLVPAVLTFSTRFAITPIRILGMVLLVPIWFVLPLSWIVAPVMLGLLGVVTYASSTLLTERCQEPGITLAA
ncbi:MAG: DUF2029 domain-containing protein [Acidobacteriota bacterium]|nr:DUF2029 domain-containing protein [Acidobacteriota bacterium]